MTRWQAAAMNIFNYLQGKVAGLQVNTADPILLLCSGAEVHHSYIWMKYLQMPDFVSSVSVNDVAYIKVFRPPFMGGFNGANGAIAIYTRRGNDVKSAPGKGLDNNKVFGYTLIKEFYSPNYSIIQTSAMNNGISALRYTGTLLLWLHLKKRQVVLTFYNNDVSNAFRVVIEGMTRDGRLAHLEQINGIRLRQKHPK